MFQLLTGSYCDLEKSFLQDVVGEKQKDPLANLLVVSPSSHLLNHLQRQLAATGPAYLNIHFLTFYALAERLLAGSAYTETIVSEPALYEEIIRDELEGRGDLPAELRRDFFGDGQTLPRGIPAALAATLKDLRDSGARVKDAGDAAAQGLLGADGAEATLALALNAAVYRRLRKADLRTSADFLRRAAEAAPQSPWLRTMETIWIYGLYDLTGVQLDLLLALANQRDARLLIPYVEKHPAYGFVNKLLKDPALLTKCAPARALPDSSPQARIEVSHCSGARDEVWQTAKEILRLVDQGIPFEAIGVVARRLDPYLGHLEEIFHTHCIPYATSRLDFAGSHPLFKTLRQLLFSQAAHTRAHLTASWLDHVRWSQAQIHEAIRASAESSDFVQALVQAMLERLESLSLLDRVLPPVSWERFAARATIVLDALRYPPAGDVPTGVQVLEVQQARGLHFQTLFILGLNEKIFPRLIREDAFLPDNARSALAQATGCRLGRKMDGYQEERLLFALMRASAPNIFALYQRSDDEGKALIPSLYLQELNGGGSAPASVPRSFAPKVVGLCGGPRLHATALLTPKELSTALSRLDGLAGTLLQALAWPEKEYDRLLANHRRLESFRPGQLPEDGRVEDATLLGRHLRTFTATALEDFATCPYRYFARHVLRLPVPDEAVEGGTLSKPGLGRLFHRTLQLYFEKVCALGTSLQFNDAVLRAACAEAAAEFLKRYPGLYPLAVESSQNIVYEALAQYIPVDLDECAVSGFQPQFMERDVEGAPGAEWGKLAAEPFRGRVDRIDVRKDTGGWQARIVEYKSGREPQKEKLETSLIRGKNPQLALYMPLARHFLETQELKPVEIASAGLRWVRAPDSDIEKFSLEGNFWQGPDAPVFLENLAGWITLVREGRFFIEPETGEHGHCEHCAFARICRKEHLPTRHRIEHDPARERNLRRMERKASRG